MSVSAATIPTRRSANRSGGPSSRMRTGPSRRSSWSSAMVPRYITDPKIQLELAMAPPSPNRKKPPSSMGLASLLSELTEYSRVIYLGEIPAFPTAPSCFLRAVQVADHAVLSRARPRAGRARDGAVQPRARPASRRAFRSCNWSTRSPCCVPERLLATAARQTPPVQRREFT